MSFQKEYMRKKISRSFFFQKSIFTNFKRIYTKAFFEKKICTRIFQIYTSGFQREYMYKNFEVCTSFQKGIYLQNVFFFLFFFLKVFKGVESDIPSNH